VANKHQQQNPKDQKANRARARKEAQERRGSKKFGNRSNPHLGSSRGQSGQQRGR
jgi:hypothetical protein